jgi:two-component system, chemotaxis family, sensor kinase CheA
MENYRGEHRSSRDSVSPWKDKENNEKCRIERGRFPWQSFSAWEKKAIMSQSEIVKEFLIESYENLDRLDRDLVNLEKNPKDPEAMAGVFRTIHTIKGTCGFLGFRKLEKVAHAGENLLTLLRDSKLTLNPERTTALLGMVDAIRQMLKEIESTGQDGEIDYPELRERLTRLQSSSAGGSGFVADSGVQPSSPVPPEYKTVDVLPAQPILEAKGRDAAPETIRVGVNLLDKLMILVGELVLARNQLLQISNTVEDTGLQAVSQRMNLIATELQEEVMKTRMQPIGNIWAQFPRTVRDVALGCGKEVEIEMEGKETELDRPSLKPSKILLLTWFATLSTTALNSLKFDCKPVKRALDG